jgi:fermentation-respiration switch protein FrsA (DUF1100 family)
MVRWLRRILVAIAAIAVLLALLIAGAAFYGAGQMMHPRRRAYTPAIETNPKDKWGMSYEEVEFRAEDGATLRGWWIPGSSEAGVVAVHGAGADRLEFLDESKWLHDAGYSVLLFDCRAAGLSDQRGRGISLGVREHRDVESAVAWMKSRGVRHVVSLGCSQGAASSIEAGAEDKDIEGVIAEASFLEPEEVLEFNVRKVRPDLSSWFIEMMSDIAVWRMGGRGAEGPIDVVSRIAPRPLLLMQGSADSMVPPDDVQTLYEHAGEPKMIWIGDGAGHCELGSKYPDQYRSRILEFMTRYFPLGANGPNPARVSSLK